MFSGPSKHHNAGRILANGHAATALLRIQYLRGGPTSPGPGGASDWGVFAEAAKLQQLLVTSRKARPLLASLLLAAMPGAPSIFLC